MSKPTISDKASMRMLHSAAASLAIDDGIRQPTGQVKVLVEELDGSGSVVDSFIAHEKNNLIVDKAREAMSKLIAEAAANYRVTTFKLGTQGNEPGDILTPIPPTVADTNLEDNTPFSKAIPSYSYVPPLAITAVQFEIIVEATEGNGTGSAVAYTEAGLFSANGNLFARETFPAIIKTASRRLTFYWTIIF